jgi:DNA-directed RNA polymerase specialized sigma24 family protein
MKAESMSEPSFAELIERLQHDDRAAVDLLIERYGNALRRAIERALWVRRLDGTASADGGALAPIGTEASDVFQTVLLLFWARLRRHREGSGASNTLRFETPAHLVAYLKTIAEHEMARRRSRSVATLHRPSPFGSLQANEPASSEPTPIQSLLAREILERDQAALTEFTCRLSADERDLWNLVRQELSWTEIAERMGGVSSPEAVRKTFARAVRRIAGELKTLVRAHE